MVQERERVLAEAAAAITVTPTVEETPQDHLKDRPESNPDPYAFLEFSIGNGPPRRITFQLFASVVPRTAENFRCLCTGERGNGRRARLHYVGSPVHRHLPPSMVALFYLTHQPLQIFSNQRELCSGLSYASAIILTLTHSPNLISLIVNFNVASTPTASLKTIPNTVTLALPLL